MQLVFVFLSFFPGIIAEAGCRHPGSRIGELRARPCHAAATVARELSCPEPALPPLSRPLPCSGPSSSTGAAARRCSSTEST